jgi:hypothetical protein
LQIRVVILDLVENRLFHAAASDDLEQPEVGQQPHNLLQERSGKPKEKVFNLNLKK